ncbi:MAG: DUF4132 domain-containing protein [Micropruina sp.]|nr:DUF4132 domain-containing protein [Micropruina sp.]
MFERLKSALTGAPAGPSQPLRQALLPAKAVSGTLYERMVAFVHDASFPEVLLEVDAAHAPELDRALLQPATLQSWTPWPDPALTTRLQQAGCANPRVSIPNARWQLYQSPLFTQPQALRLGHLLAALGAGPNRRVEGVPWWLIALINDLCGTLPDKASRQLNWPPERFADLLRHDGADERQIPSLIFLAFSEQVNGMSSARVQPHALPAIDNYLLGFGHLIPPDAVDRLSARGRTGVAERAVANPACARVLAPMLARLAADKAKGVRSAAVTALPMLPADLQAFVLRPVLLTVPAGQAGELIEYLSRTPQGAALLNEAVAAGAKLGAAVEKANARRDALATAHAVRVLIVPPFVPLPDELDQQRAVAELRRFVDAQLARHGNPTHDWQRRRVKELRAVTDADLRRLVAGAAGLGPRPVVGEALNSVQIADAVPSFNLVHLLRLQAPKQRRSVIWLVPIRSEQITDLRQVEDAIRRSINTTEALDDVPRLARASSYHPTLEPEVTWPWFADRLDVLQAWLTGDATDIGDALAVLDGFPSIPPALLPALAAVALGTSRRNRPEAQALLTRHGAASALAEQGLSDGKAELRAASADWLADQSSADALPALRAALGKEKREVPRAAMLRALQSLGDDISADLAPERLLAEAKAGLRAKVPDTLDWFGFDQLPALQWRDGTPVDPLIPRWWAVLANKLKDPDGSGLLDLYLEQLAPASAEALGRFVFDSWLAQDVRHPSEEQSRVAAAATGAQRHQYAQGLVTRLQVNPGANGEYLAWAREQAALPRERHVQQAFAEHQGTYLGSAAAHRGLLALTTRVPGIELADGVQGYIRNHGGRRAQVDALMYALFANGQPAAVQLLLSISRRFKQASVQATAAALVEKLAERRGWSADELADRTIPTAGFDPDALLRLDFGSRQFLGRATPGGTIELSTTDGKPIKALPAPRAADDDELVKAAKKQLTTSRKELKAVLNQQSARLYEAMCAARSWPAADWSEFLLTHPLVGQLVSRLVWVIDPGPGQRLFRPTEDGSLIDADDETVELPDDARVGLAHRVSVGGAASDIWLAHLADYEVTPLFDQFGNGLPALDREATAVTDLKGHLTDTFSVRGVATKRGYQRGAAEDGAWFNEYSKAFSSAGLTAVLEFTGSYLPEENIPCATIGLSFRARRRRVVPLSEVPDVLLAESYADYAALAALGPFDLNWQQKAGT